MTDARGERVRYPRRGGLLLERQITGVPAANLENDAEHIEAGRALPPAISPSMTSVLNQPSAMDRRRGQSRLMALLIDRRKAAHFGLRVSARLAVSQGRPPR